MRFADKVAIVTGGASGIGLATSRALATEGATVVVADVDGQRAAEVAAEVAAGGGRARAAVVDVTDAAAVRSMVDEALAAHGHIDILVNNAGWDRVMPFADSDEALWDRVIAINYRGQLACSHAVLGPMLAAGSGCIVNVASAAGRVGSSGEAVYSGAKGAVIAFTKTLAREVARSGIRVNCVAPGLVDTPLLTQVTQGNEKLMAAIVRSIPLGRVGQPEDIARVILFLASADAAYMTGQTVSVDGGLTML